MIVVTLATLMLFGFAALAVDVGHGMSERRRAQSTADASVMAAAVELNLAGAGLQDLVDQALAFADRNAPQPIPTDAWLNDCPDTVDPSLQLEHTAAEIGLIPATDCISFNAGFSEIRVSLPQRDVDTFFAGVIGIDTFDVTAFAHATIHLAGYATTPPFVVTSTASAGDERCLRSGGAASVIMPPKWIGNGIGAANPPTLGPEGDPDFADACDDTVFDRDSEFFGSLKAWAYADCTQPSGNEAIAEVVAAGLDHPLTSYEPDYTAGDPERIDGDGCQDPNDRIPEPWPNTIELQTGYTARMLQLGMLALASDTPRLKRGDHVQYMFQFNGEDMDNTPLWEYLRSDIESVNAPASCVEVYENKANPDYDVFDLKELMLDCLATWRNNPSDDIIFAADDDPASPSITTSARFAWIPQIAETTLAGLDGKLVHIDAFVPVFINGLYQISKQEWQSAECWTQHSAQGNDSGWSRHEAGQAFDCGIGGNNAQLTRLTAIVIPCGALPATICVDDSVSSGPGGIPTHVLELTR